MSSVRYHRRDAFGDIVQALAVNGIAGIAHQEIAAQLIVVHRHHRARFAHPGIDGKRHLIVVAPRNILYRTTGFPGEINKSTPAGIPFHQGETPLHRLAFQTRHGE